jgi:hypothetical protein
MKFAAHPLQLVLGPAVWLAWFGTVYGALSVACAVAAPAAQRGPFNGVNAALLLLTLATAAGLAAAAWACARESRRRPEGQRVLAWSAALLHGVAAVATLAVGGPIALLPPCV